MKLAAIDLGTNTFHLIIAEQNGNDLQIVYKTNQPVKLGEQITVANTIIPSAFERGINCLKEFKSIVDQFEIHQVKAVATSGVRSAKNGLDFIEAVRLTTGFEVEIIDGDEEAQYIYEGVKLSGAIDGNSLIMDIGGGSTEFILCDAENLVWKKSYNIGAARLAQQFFKSDPISPHDFELLINHISEELKAFKIIAEEYQPVTLIGSAGAFESYTNMIEPTAKIDEISTAAINYKAYRQLADKLIRSTHSERLVMPGLIPLRVDMIVMASILTNYILDQLNINQIRLSTYDLKMGLLQSIKN